MGNMHLPARLSLASVAGLVATLIVLAPAGYLGALAALAESASYQRLFPGSPSSPQPFNPPDMDITVLGHDSNTILPMQAGHGPDCGPPPATHLIVNIEDAVFQCKNHVMTAMFNGYGAIYLTPNQLMDFSSGEAVLRWNMSTLRTSSRDWVDVVIMPFDENLQINFEDAHVPQDAVHLEMVGGGNVFQPTIWRNFVKEDVRADMFNSYDRFLEPSAVRRDTFELHLSRTHIRFGMPDYNVWWIDTDIQPLSWNLGVVQLNQRAYNPEKACATPDNPASQVEDAIGAVDNPYGAAHCPPNTWHWDNININPAVPFALLRADRRVVDASSSSALSFGGPAPADSHLHFVAVGTPIEYSLDGGSTWQPAAVQGRPLNKPEHGEAYWTPVPAGTQSVLLRGQDHGNIRWSIQDISIWGPPGSQSDGTITPLPPAAVTTASAPTQALATAPAAASASGSVSAAVPGTITFDDLSNPNRVLNGQYPSGVIDWGNSSWYLSGPYGGFRNQSIGFDGAGPTSESFSFVAPTRLVQLDAFNGGDPTTVTLSCDGQPDVERAIPRDQLVTIQTNWASPCSKVTITSTNGWDTNFKNLVLDAAR